MHGLTATSAVSGTMSSASGPSIIKHKTVRADGSVCLQSILNAFNSAIKEEHAWALCYQCSKFFIECTKNGVHGCYETNELGQVFLLTDGNVHMNTLYLKDVSDKERKPVSNVQDLVSGLGFIIYYALGKSFYYNII